MARMKLRPMIRTDAWHRLCAEEAPSGWRRPSRPALIVAEEIDWMAPGTATKFKPM